MTVGLRLNATVSVSGQQAAAELARVEGAVNRVNQAQQRLSQTSGQLRASTANLGQQIGDISQGLAAGTPIATIYAQQIGQVAFAASGMGGAIGKVATFLSGPWGAAITGATVILAALARSHDIAGASATKQVSAEEGLKNAIKELNEITGRSFETEEQRLRQRVITIGKLINETVATRDLIKAQLELNESKRRNQDITAQSGGFGGAQFAQTAQADTAIRNSLLAAQLKSQDEKIANARRSASDAGRGIEAFDADRRVAARNDPRLAAEEKYKAARAATFALIKSGSISAAAGEAQYDAALKKKNATLESLKDVVGAARKAQTEHNKEIREAGRAAAEAAREIAEFNKAVDAGRQSITNNPANNLSAPVDTSSLGNLQLETITKGLETKLPQFGTDAGQAFADQALTQAVAIGQSIGGTAGGLISAAAGLLKGARTGDFTGVGGRTGGLLTLAGSVKGGAGTNGGAFSDGFKETFKDPLESIGKKFDTFLGKGAGSFAKLAGQAAGGAATGSLVSGIGDALGIKNSKAGAQIGGAIGSIALGPLGGLIGGVLGGILPGLFASKPKGSTTVSSSGGQISQSSTGNSAITKATGQLGNSITDAIQSIAQQLGADIGDFSVSIGKEGERFRVDTTGAGRTKKNNSTVLGFDTDAGAALAAAIADALKDGAIKTSPRVQAALTKYGDNVNKAIAEALKVKGLEDLLADRGNPFLSTFRNLELQLKQRVEVASQYGFDLVEIERINGEDRAKALKETLAGATGSIKNLLSDFQFGSRSTGSVGDQLKAAVAERDRLTGLVRGGDTGQVDAIASIVQKIDDLQKQAFGSTQGFAGGRADSVALLNDVVKQTEDRIKAAADQAKAATDTTNAKLAEANASLDDLVGLGQQQLRALQAMGAGTIGIGGSIGFNLAAQYARDPR